MSVNIRMAHPAAAEVALWPVPCVSSPALNGEGHLPNPSEDHFDVGNIQTASETVNSGNQNEGEDGGHGGKQEGGME